MKYLKGSGVQATVWFEAIPTLPDVVEYIAQGCVPGGTQRNFDSYGHLIGRLTDLQRSLLCDPQTSGGLLIAVTPESEGEVIELAKKHQIVLTAIGELTVPQAGRALIEVI